MDHLQTLRANMARPCTSGLLLLAAAVLLGGCEHATGLGQPSRILPDPHLVRSITGLEPAELAMLLDMADRVPPSHPSGEPWLSSMAHPLDGLAPDRVQQLFTAAGLSAKPYAPWLLPCDSCTGRSDAR